MVSEPRKRPGEQLLIRFPEASDLKGRLTEAAEANNRSLSSEVVFRLEQSFEAEVPNFVPNFYVERSAFDALVQEIKALVARVDALEHAR